MMQRFEAEELDRDTLDYLGLARERHGRGLPGIFLDAREARLYTASLPWWSLGLGPALILLTLLLTWGSLSDPVGVALFLTGGFLLGGWMLVAALRCLVARARADYLGDFKYIDPLYIWHGTGTGVWVTPIDMLLGADVHHSHDEHDNYKHSTVRVRLADDKLDLDVYGREKAEQVEEYLEALAEIRDGSPAERGYAAVEEVSEYEDEYDDEDEEEARERVVEEVPRPQRARTSLGWLPLVLLPVVGLALFFACKWLATRLRDDAYFNVVKAKQVQDLRAYLSDPRNTRHRAEVVKLLQGHYARQEGPLLAQGDPELMAGLVDLLRAVAGEARPVITLGFAKQAKRPDTPQGYLSAAVLETLDRQVIKEITDRLAQRIGQNYADYAEVTDGHAMITFTPKVTVPPKEEGGPREVRIDWAVTIQADPEAKKRTLILHTKRVLTGDDPVPAVRGLYLELAAAFNRGLTMKFP
jgi:hypothetical protein